MKISLVFLTYNEIVGLRELFDKVPLSSVDEYFAVDGGSTDGTIEFFKQKKVTVHVQTVKGRGEAFRLAFEKAIGDAIIFFSPDGNEDPIDIPKFRPFLEKEYDMVIANRMGKGCHNEEDEQFFKWRKWANNGFTFMANISWNKAVYIQDTINGYRAITKKAWDMLKPNGHNYTIEYQSSIRCFKKGLKIAEFPTHEAKRIDNRVGSPSFSTGIAFLKLYWNELLIKET